MIRSKTGTGRFPSEASTFVKLLICAGLVAGFPATSWAVDNSIYIDQAGDNANIAITQDGAGNRVKGIVLNAPGQTNDPAKIYGDGIQVNISQIGAGNVLAGVS